MVLSLGKKNEQTSAQMRTDAPVWEQGFSFLVANPDNDVLLLRVVDQKTEKELGRLVYNLSALLEKNNLEIVSQPFQLQKSGPESKILMSLSLRILRTGQEQEDDSISQVSSEQSPSSNGEGSLLNRSVSERYSNNDASPTPLQKQDSKRPQSMSQSETFQAVEEPFVMSTSNSTVLSAAPQPSAPRTPDSISDNSSTIIHRSPSTTSSAGFAGLGRIQLTLRYSVQRQRLVVIVHKIM